MNALVQLLVACAAMALVGLLMGVIVRGGIDDNTIPPVSPHRWQGSNAHDEPCIRWRADCN